MRSAEWRALLQRLDTSPRSSRNRDRAVFLHIVMAEIFVTNQDPPNRHRRTPVNDVDLAENFIKIANDVLKLLLAGSDGAVQVEIGGGYAGGNSRQ
ncbi:Uncharacterised protein [Klebsiella michiganensis]|uniref:Uncharacterized protein n=1 Tax=Klebsiella michiganensis TaxID=1134687 RepID=A0A7H4N261_9ENTR|nr:Uncharacterised protein [Klebsiella michiganensis]